ncbi:unnamed protein product [Polarella glacialis]|uniref:Uncharacterized protein n=1 Tax=Polarella glacialis TaxID=89957 RepID=A0A813D3E9_POLGL|nr:unnamed protein product [Polarella glacialis]
MSLPSEEEVLGDLVDFICASSGCVSSESFGTFFIDYPAHKAAIKGYTGSLWKFCEKHSQHFSIGVGNGPHFSLTITLPSEPKVVADLTAFVKQRGGTIASTDLGSFHKSFPLYKRVIYAKGRTLHEFFQVHAGRFAVDASASKIRFTISLRHESGTSVAVAATLALFTDSKGSPERQDDVSDSDSDVSEEDMLRTGLELPVSSIRWAHDCIKIRFKDGRHLIDTLKDLLDGKLVANQLPAFHVFQRDGAWHAITGNRRLWVLKEFQALTGKPLLVQVRRLSSSSAQTSWFKNMFTTTNGGKSVQFVLKNRWKSDRYPSMAFALEACDKSKPPNDLDRELAYEIAAAKGAVAVAKLELCTSWKSKSKRQGLDIKQYLQGKPTLFKLSGDDCWLVSLASPLAQTCAGEAGASSSQPSQLQWLPVQREQPKSVEGAEVSGKNEVQLDMALLPLRIESQESETKENESVASGENSVQSVSEHTMASIVAPATAATEAPAETPVVLLVATLVDMPGAPAVSQTAAVSGAVSGLSPLDAAFRDVILQSGGCAKLSRTNSTRPSKLGAIWKTQGKGQGKLVDYLRKKGILFKVEKIKHQVWVSVAQSLSGNSTITRSSASDSTSKASASSSVAASAVTTKAASTLSELDAQFCKAITEKGGHEVMAKLGCLKTWKLHRKGKGKLQVYFLARKHLYHMTQTTQDCVISLAKPISTPGNSLALAKPASVPRCSLPSLSELDTHFHSAIASAGGSSVLSTLNSLNIWKKLAGSQASLRSYLRSKPEMYQFSKDMTSVTATGVVCADRSIKVGEPDVQTRQTISLTSSISKGVMLKPQWLPVATRPQPDAGQNMPASPDPWHHGGGADPWQAASLEQPGLLKSGITGTASPSQAWPVISLGCLVEAPKCRSILQPVEAVEAVEAVSAARGGEEEALEIEELRRPQGARCGDADEEAADQDSGLGSQPAICAGHGQGLCKTPVEQNHPSQPSESDAEPEVELCTEQRMGPRETFEQRSSHVATDSARDADPASVAAKTAEHHQGQQSQPMPVATVVRLAPAEMSQPADVSSRSPGHLPQDARNPDHAVPGNPIQSPGVPHFPWATHPVLSSTDLDVLMRYLPEQLRDEGESSKICEFLRNSFAQRVVLQVGSQVQLQFSEGWLPARASGETLSYKASQRDLDEVCDLMDFKPDSSVGPSLCIIPGSLHRASFCHDPAGQISRITLHIARRLAGACRMALELLISRSVIFLGPVSSGKTSILRDAAAALSRTAQVIVVDFLLELGCHPNARHLGNAGRCLPPIDAHPLEAITQAIEEHMPEIIIAEFANPIDALCAGKLCHEAGVRLICSVRCSMDGLAESFVCSGHSWPDGKKVAPAPTCRSFPFDAAVLLSRHDLNLWQVLPDARAAVCCLQIGHMAPCLRHHDQGRPSGWPQHQRKRCAAREHGARVHSPESPYYSEATQAGQVSSSSGNFAAEPAMVGQTRAASGSEVSPWQGNSAQTLLRLDAAMPSPGSRLPQGPPPVGWMPPFMPHPGLLGYPMPPHGWRPPLPGWGAPLG